MIKEDAGRSLDCQGKDINAYCAKEGNDKPLLYFYPENHMDRKCINNTYLL